MVEMQEATLGTPCPNQTSPLSRDGIVVVDSGNH